MIKLLAIVLLGFLFLTSVHAAWQLDWSDEFNGDNLDLKKWDIEVNCWGGGQAQKQCYTSRPENVWVSGGSLHLKPVAEEYRGSSDGCTLNKENSCTWSQPATSARIRSFKAVDGAWKYGRFEIRAKLPKGDFLWPAIWMLPKDYKYGTWAASGEIDIMEARGQNPKAFSSALHFGAMSPNNKHIGTNSKFYDFDLTEDFHTYTLEWEASQIKIYVDNILHWTQTLDRSFGSLYPRNRAPFDERFHLIMNVAVGGNFFNKATYGSVDVSRDSRTWTQEMQVDFVRVYKWVDTPAPTPVLPAPSSAPTPIRSPVTTILPPSSNDDNLSLPPTSDVIIPSSDMIIPSVSNPQDDAVNSPLDDSSLDDSPQNSAPGSSPVSPSSVDDISQDTATELETMPSTASSSTLPHSWLFAFALVLFMVMTMA